MTDGEPARAEDEHLLGDGRALGRRDEVAVDGLGDGLGGALPGRPDEDEEGVEEALEVLGPGGVLGVELHGEDGEAVRDDALVGAVVGVGEEGPQSFDCRVSVSQI